MDIDGIKLCISELFPTDQKSITKASILRGDFDIGFPIVPITLRHRMIGKNGESATKDVVMCGRAFSLQTIMDRTLVEQEQAGTLRQPYRKEADIDEALRDLRTKGMCYEHLLFSQHCEKTIK